MVLFSLANMDKYSTSMTHTHLVRLSLLSHFVFFHFDQISGWESIKLTLSQTRDGRIPPAREPVTYTINSVWSHRTDKLQPAVGAAEFTSSTAHTGC